MRLLRKQKNSYDRAMDWFKANMVRDKGIIVHTRQAVPYPEVTGYFIPTLYQWQETELARTCTKWLLSVQLPDGAFPAPDGVPYTFDTAQVMRGLCAALEHGEDVEQPLRKACDWIVGQIDPSGRLNTPSTALWGDIASDLIHTYAIFPLIQAGQVLGKPEYVEAGRFVQAFYKSQEALVPFNRLSHFHAYAMEALWELGELDLAEPGHGRCRKGPAQGRRRPRVPGRQVGVLDGHGTIRGRLVSIRKGGTSRPCVDLPRKHSKQVRRFFGKLRGRREIHTGRRDQLGGQVFSRRVLVETAQRYAG